MESKEPETKKKRKITKKGCLGCMGIGAGLFLLLAFIGSLLPDPPPLTPEQIAAAEEAQRQRDAERRQREIEREEAQRQRDAEQLQREIDREIERGHENRLEAHRRAAKECVDEWTGSVFELGHAIRDRLNDPDSYQHDSTRITDLSAWQRAREIVKDDMMPGKARAQAAGELQALVRPPFDYTGGGRYYVETEFRATNRFGGVVRGLARATVDQNCEVHTLISID